MVFGLNDFFALVFVLGRDLTGRFYVCMHGNSIYVDIFVGFEAGQFGGIIASTLGDNGMFRKWVFQSLNEKVMLKSATEK